MRDLLRTAFFPPRNGQGWWYYIKERFTEFPHVVKAMYQRATRGWADCDVWSIDAWFTAVTPDMLRKLRDNGYGYPGSLAHLGDDLGPKEWARILTQMADDLEAIDRFNEQWFYSDEALYDVNDHGLEQSRRCYVAEMEASRVVQRGLFEFYVWFFHLWD